MKEEGEKTGISSLLWEWREAPIVLYLPQGAERDELWILHPPLTFYVRNATAAQHLRLQRSSPGFSLTVTQDRLQFRTQELGQTSRRYSLSLRMIHSFSIHCTLASLLPIYPLCFTLICLQLFPAPLPTLLTILPPPLP